MKRDWAALTEGKFDLLVVGAGIHGICAAWDATQRGLRVALVDRGDFCGQASSNSLRIVHGGLRYLQQADLKRMRFSIRERSTLLRIAPGLVKPLPCILPTGRRLMRRRFVLRTAFRLNDWISRKRDRSLLLADVLRPEQRSEGRLKGRPDAPEKLVAVRNRSVETLEGVLDAANDAVAGVGQRSVEIEE